MWADWTQRTHLATGGPRAACGRLLRGTKRPAVGWTKAEHVTCGGCKRRGVPHVPAVHVRDGYRQRALCGVGYDVGRYAWTDTADVPATCGTCCAVARRRARDAAARAARGVIHWATAACLEAGQAACGTPLGPGSRSTTDVRLVRCRRCRKRKTAAPGWGRRRRLTGPAVHYAPPWLAGPACGAPLAGKPRTAAATAATTCTRCQWTYAWLAVSDKPPADLRPPWVRAAADGWRLVRGGVRGPRGRWVSDSGRRPVHAHAAAPPPRGRGRPSWRNARLHWLAAQGAGVPAWQLRRTAWQRDYAAARAAGDHTA